jgi:hypothetical protein
MRVPLNGLDQYKIGFTLFHSSIAFETNCFAYPYAARKAWQGRWKLGRVEEFLPRSEYQYPAEVYERRPAGTKF